MLGEHSNVCIIVFKSVGLPIAVRDAHASLAYLLFKSRALCAAFVVVGREN